MAEYGVGKTTLMKKFFMKYDYEGRLVHILTRGGKNMDDVARIVLEQIGYGRGGESRTRFGLRWSAEGVGWIRPVQGPIHGQNRKADVKRKSCS